MTPRTLTLLAMATALSVAAAGYAVSREAGFMTASRGEVIFPDLGKRIDEVSKIEIRTVDRTMTMKQGKGGWIMVESGGYALQSKIVKGAILGVASLTYVEAKTRQADKYQKLELRDPETAESHGRGVRIYTKNGDRLADTILGKVRYDMPGTTRDGVYIRQPGNPQTWLALGQVDISRLPSDWLKQEIVNINSDRVKSAETRHPDGEVISVSKQAPTDRNFVMAGIPENKKLKYDRDPDNIATVLENFELDDARRVSDVSFDPEQTISTRITTFDGLNVAIKMFTEKKGGASKPQYWVTLSASATDTSPERQKEVSEINAHTTPWVYQIPGYKASRLNKRMSEILKDKEPAT